MTSGKPGASGRAIGGEPASGGQCDCCNEPFLPSEERIGLLTHHVIENPLATAEATGHRLAPVNWDYASAR
jgi:hypothetical protein